MLSDRSYMRDDYPRTAFNAVTWLISAIVAAFVLQFVFLRWFNAGSAFNQALALTPGAIASGKVWTLFSYSFLHSTANLLHVVGNLLALFFLGRVLQPMLGARRFTWLYVGAVVTGALLWVATHWQDPASIAIGASAGVAGLFVVFACFFPNQPITFLLFFFIPVSIKPKHAAIALVAFEVAGFVFYELMRSVSPFGGSAIAHSAHLGGMIAGWVYFRYLHAASWKFSPTADVEPPRWFKKSAAKPTLPPVYQVHVTRREDLRAEVDRILDKINSEGFGALTADEKRLLDEARDLLSRR